MRVSSHLPFLKLLIHLSSSSPASVAVDDAAAQSSIARTGSSEAVVDMVPSATLTPPLRTLLFAFGSIRSLQRLLSAHATRTCSCGDVACW
jgi:hypothetical protein